MSGADIPQPGRSPLRLRTRRLAFVTAAGLVVVIVLGLIGRVVRDPSVPAAILMYLPVLPASLAAVVLDLALSGRSIVRPRYAVTILGLAAAAAAAIPMLGSGPAATLRASSAEVAMLHWNVQWGGGLFRSPSTWSAQRAMILKRKPDLIILSELPPRAWLDELVGDLGPDATCAGAEHGPGSRYWYHLAVCSRWPVKAQQCWRWPGGVALEVTAQVRGRPLRLLVVDGKSNPFQSRLPFLHAIANVCRTAEEQGRPFDVIAGDFNTPSRSVGFDDLVKQGYTIASQAARGWRATFPSWLPIYDIDHVLVRGGLAVAECTLFNGPSTDHRGQFVRFYPDSGDHD